MKDLVKTEQGFDIYFEALEEHIPLTQLFEECDLQETIKKVNSGEWVYFCAKVTAFKGGVELASDYLGGCVYDSYEDFYIRYKDDYFADMVQTVIEQSKVQAKEIIKALSE